MPAIVLGNSAVPPQAGSSLPNKNGKSISVLTEEYRDFYPILDNGKTMDLTPGSSWSEYIKERVMNRAREAERKMIRKHSSWQAIDEMLHVFINLDKEEQEIIDRDPRKPVSIVIPESYAIRETILTYFLGVFGTNPVWKFNPVGPEDAIGAALLELVQQNQVDRSNVLLSLLTMWSDGLTYGFGAAAPNWTVEEGKKVVANELGFYGPDGTFIRTGMERSLEDAILFEGNKLDTIDPYLFLPDPDIGLHEVQDGGFVSWLATSTYETLRAMELERDSFLFNVQHLRSSDQGSSIYKQSRAIRELPRERERGAGRGDNRTQAGHDTKRGNETQSVDTIYQYVDLIPSEWRNSKREKLGDSEQPETWLFGLSGDQVVIVAHKVERLHKKFPIVTCVPDFDGHTESPVSRLELIHGLMISTNFLHNSHQYAIMKSLRNQLIADPKSINMKDVMAQTGVIRTRRNVWGKGVKESIMQLQVQDITQNNAGDIEFNRQTTRNISAAVDSAQGIQRVGGERVTAEEFSSTRSAALSRLQKTARVISLQSHRDIGLIFAKNTQLFMSEDAFVQTVGRHQERLMKEYGFDQTSFIPVSPFDLSIDFDLEIHDGSIEGSEHVRDWIQLYQIVAGSEELQQTQDVTRIFQHIARLMGAENVHDFGRNQQQQQIPGGVAPEVGTDEEVAQAVQERGLAAI